jgi:hypothetical protein
VHIFCRAPVSALVRSANPADGDAGGVPSSFEYDKAGVLLFKRPCMISAFRFRARLSINPKRNPRLLLSRTMTSIADFKQVRFLSLYCGLSIYLGFRLPTSKPIFLTPRKLCLMDGRDKTTGVGESAPSTRLLTVPQHPRPNRSIR